jgi:hypothetical protein
MDAKGYGHRSDQGELEHIGSVDGHITAKQHVEVSDNSHRDY